MEEEKKEGCIADNTIHLLLDKVSAYSRKHTKAIF